MRTFFCGLTQNRLTEIKVGYPQIKEFLQPDDMVVVDGGSTDGSIEFLKRLGVTLIEQPFRDFVQQRTAYTDFLEESAEEGDLVVVSDTDEYIAPSLLQNLKNIAVEAWDKDANLLTIRCRSEWVDKHGNLLDATLDGFHKPLVALWEHGGKYKGVASDRPIHEELHFPSGRRFLQINDQNGMHIYVHRKRYGIQFARAIRNLYLSGIDPSGVIIPEWQEFKDLFTGQGFKTWPEVERYLKRGIIHSSIKHWLIERRYHPIGEVKNSFIGYFIYYHPDELPSELVPEYAEEIKKMHGYVPG